MAKVEIELNYEGLSNLWKDPAIAQQCAEVAQAVKSKLGGSDDDYNVSSYIGQHRAGAALWVNSSRAIKDNLENNTVLKALGGVIPSSKISAGGSMK